MIDSGLSMRCLLDRLSVADPDVAQDVEIRIGQIPTGVKEVFLQALVEDTIWGLSVETSFGWAIARGYLGLIADSRTEDSQIRFYGSLLHEFGAQGPTVGRILAIHLPAVLRGHDHGLQQRYLDTFRVMHRKGSYTLKGPFECASRILNTGDRASADAFLELLQNTFNQEMSYNRCLQLTYTLPKAVDAFPPSKRLFQIQQLSRIVLADLALVEPFLEGLARGLNLLAKEKLERFVMHSLERHEQDPLMGRRFLSLASRISAEACSAMQVAAPLSSVRHRLSRYVRARTGVAVGVQPVSAHAARAAGGQPGGDGVFSDGKFIYLPDEIDLFDNREKNQRLYWDLVRLESGLFEFGTFEFDLEKALVVCRGGLPAELWPPNEPPPAAGASELDRFLRRFEEKRLATALFTVFEHGRIRLLLQARYPGLVQRTLPGMQEEARRLYRETAFHDILHGLYARIALGMEPGSCPAGLGRDALTDWAAVLFEQRQQADNRVETSAWLVHETYGRVKAAYDRRQHRPRLTAEGAVLQTPYGRCIRPDLIGDDHRPYEARAVAIKDRLREKGLGVFKADLRRKLGQNRGALSPLDVKDMVVKIGPIDRPFGEARGGRSVDLSDLETFDFDDGFRLDGLIQNADAARVVKYPEWDCRINDYLDNHVRVMDRYVTGCDGTFYSDTLRRHQGLVANMRRAFELLKPEGLAILRQWVEGDQFDYRALLDFAIDRKAGRIPSDRLYIKRMKQQRDVAALILVDLSRSTTNKAADSSATVLDIEKEAIVLFAEALGVVGDAFAIAGFSGTGRLGVDYFRIKDFSDAPDETFFRRINAMSPQRSTRMGAAIRHAVSELEHVPAKVRVMITIGDGFPNDVGYKQGYAIADTRKAVQEAYSKNIYFKAITVNIAGDPKLDDLYGQFNHNVISDIRELPDRLLWIYSAMTKM